MNIKERVRAAIPEIERLVSEGKSRLEIAEAIGVNPNTLSQYRRELGLSTLRQGRILGPSHKNWRGGRSVEKRSGYVRLFCDTDGRPRYIYEHAYVAEQILGRRLAANEVVHHINCDKTDNRPENLLVVTRAQHVRLHRQLEAIGLEMLRRGHVEFSNDEYRLTL